MKRLGATAAFFDGTRVASGLPPSVFVWTVQVSMENHAAVAALSALALDTRLTVLRLLARSGEDGLPAGEVARRLGQPQNTVSDHLQMLVRAGLLSSQRKGRSIIYRANGEALEDLISFLHSECLAPAQA